MSFFFEGSQAAQAATCHGIHSITISCSEMDQKNSLEAFQKFIPHIDLDKMEEDSFLRSTF